MVEIGSGAERKQEDLMLTRYACYLIAQNGEPKKEQRISELTDSMSASAEKNFNAMRKKLER